MKKYASIFAVVLMAMTACNKNEAPVETPSASSPVKMTLTATIGADTKVTYTDEDNVLKSAWKTGDKVSLVSVNSSGIVLSVDNFETSSAGKTATFTGTFKNAANTAAVWVYYPALTEGDGSEETPFMSPVENGYSEEGILNGVKLGKGYVTIRSGYYLQMGNGDTSHLSDYAIMMGEAQVEGNTFITELEHQAYIVKATLTLPVGQEYDLRASEMRLYNSGGLSSTDHPLTLPGWRATGEPSTQAYGAPSAVLRMNLGAELPSGSGSGVTLEGNTATVYFVGYGSQEINKDDYCYIEVSGYIGGVEFNYSSSPLKFGSDKTLETGKMYRVNTVLN